MKCALTGVAAFLICGALVALLLPSVRAGGSYRPKTLAVKVRVIDTDEGKPVAAAKVTFFRSREIQFADAERTLAGAAPNDLPSAVTDADGNAELTGTFPAWANRVGSDRWYRLGDGWLTVVASGRPTAFVALDGHKFGGEREYDDDEPLEVIVVMNQTPKP